MDFGDYCTIEQKRYGAKNELFIYKVIGSGKANYFTPVPVDANNTKAKGEMCDIVKCICAGVVEEEVKTFREQDVCRKESKIASSSTGFVMLPDSLTSENGAKYLLNGEFKVTSECDCWDCSNSDEEDYEDCTTCGGSGIIVDSHIIDWPIIKDIYAKIVENMASPVAGWLPMDTAPKDGTPVLLKFNSDLNENGRKYENLVFIGRNRGDIMDWGFAAPVGVGGFPDEWLEGWKPLGEERKRSEARC